MSLRDEGSHPAASGSGDLPNGAAPLATSVVAHSPVPVAATVATPPKRRLLRKAMMLTMLTLTLTLALAGGGYKGYEWWTVGRFFVSTDDAYVQADISILAAKVPGYLAAVPVMNGQAVRKGDVIARLDDGDYRLAAQAAA